MQPQRETAVVEVNKKLLKDLEALGFSPARAAWALHYSGNTSLEEAVNWIIDHENETSFDNMPLVELNIDIESPRPTDTTEGTKARAKELRAQARKKREEEEKKLEREKEKERIRAGKEHLEAKRIAEENERKRYIESWKMEKEEEKKARQKILQKLEADKLERRKRLGLPLEGPSLKPSLAMMHDTTNFLPSKARSKSEQMRECLRSIRCNYRDDDARVKSAFQTLLIYVRNVAKDPDNEKYRKIRLTNPLFHDRIGCLKGGIEFLELCGFERQEGSEFLYIPRDKVNMSALHESVSHLNSALTNPFFGILSRAGGGA